MSLGTVASIDYIVLDGQTVKATDAAQGGKFYKAYGNWYYVAKDHDSLKSLVTQWNDDDYSSDPNKALTVTDDDNNSHDIPLNQVVTTKITDMTGIFEHASDFDQAIGRWDVSNVTNMDRMFIEALVFNQDLSGWCVEKIPFHPTKFAVATQSWSEPKPVWGTCP
jgi:hypothetical protein